MGARLRQIATPRKLVAAECCVAVFGAASAVLVLGATELALALIGVCILTMAPALVLVGRLDRRGAND